MTVIGINIVGEILDLFIVFCWVYAWYSGDDVRAYIRAV